MPLARLPKSRLFEKYRRMAIHRNNEVKTLVSDEMDVRRWPIQIFPTTPLKLIQMPDYRFSTLNRGILEFPLFENDFFFSEK